MTSRLRPLMCLLILLLASAASQAGQPLVAIIIDDMGTQGGLGKRAVNLPGPVVYAFLPHTPHTVGLAELAHRQGKQVMLHLPMQAMEGNALGPGGITLHMTRGQFREAFRRNLQAVPHVTGVNNHMGSLLTRHPGLMAWLMEEIREQGDLFFVDSRTTKHTVAERVAQESAVPVVRRHVFLDHHTGEAAIDAEVDRLVALAHRQGYAVAIGHPRPDTLAVLERRLPQLEREGVRLVTVSELIASMHRKEEELWRASLSR